MKNKRAFFGLLLVLFVLSLGTGCSSAPKDKGDGYVDAGANATPAKKGKNAGAEAP